MIGVALEALVGGEPDAEAVATALATIPAAGREEALRWLVREHGTAALPVLRHCLGGRPEWALAAASALGTLRAPEAAALLEAAEAGATDKAVRTALRRARYRLRQAGIAPAPSPARPAGGARRFRLTDAWMSAIDGSGARGVWLAIEGPYGERTLLAAVVAEEAGILDFSAAPLAKKHLDARRQALQRESPLPWVAAPPAWAWRTLVAAATRGGEPGRPAPAELLRWIERLGPPAELGAPIHARLPAAAAADPTRLERSAELLALPELGGWFLDPERLTADAVEWLQARESRLVLSEPLKAERLAALIDRVAERELDAAGRVRWRHRLEEQAYVLLELGRPVEAAMAVAVADALGDPSRPVRAIPFVRALVERSLEVAGEVATGRLSADTASRTPRRPALTAPGA